MIKYDHEYYYNLLKIHAGTAQKICNIRWEWVKKNLEDGDHLVNALDYGSGIGFMKAFAPDWIEEVDTYDIMPVIQTGVRSNHYSLVMLNDVLEHIPDFTELLPILNKTTYVLVTVPIKPPKLAWDKYKHFKPGEHLHYFTDDLLTYIFKIMGFKTVAKGQPECPPREHIWSYLFKREER